VPTTVKASFKNLSCGAGTEREPAGPVTKARLASVLIAIGVLPSCGGGAGTEPTVAAPIVPIVAVPVLLLPAEGAILDNGCASPVIWDFDWSDVPDATSYHLDCK
jgi:hypothetical protein